MWVTSWCHYQNVSLGTLDGLLLDIPCNQMFRWTPPKYPCWHVLQMTPRLLYMPLERYHNIKRSTGVLLG